MRNEESGMKNKPWAENEEQSAKKRNPQPAPSFMPDSSFLILHYYNNVRGSVITPVTAAAAAVRGEARSVREPGP